MTIDWDVAKNEANVAKHGIDFADLVDFFDQPLLCRRDERFDYGEPRWITMGRVKGRLLVAVYTERAPDTIRVISARKANSREARHYEKAIRRLQD